MNNICTRLLGNARKLLGIAEINLFHCYNKSVHITISTYGIVLLYFRNLADMDVLSKSDPSKLYHVTNFEQFVIGHKCNRNYYLSLHAYRVLIIVCVCVCVCMYIYIYIHPHTYAHTHI